MTPVRDVDARLALIQPYLPSGVTALIEVGDHNDAWISADLDHKRTLRQLEGDVGEDGAEVLWQIIERMGAELAAQAEALTRLHTALTPSMKTKATYMGEFKFDVPFMDEEGNEVELCVDTPWDTIKQIMAAIRSHATATGGGGHG